jgi:ribosomal protein L11 methyltransferase
VTHRFHPPENLVIYEAEGVYSPPGPPDLGPGFQGYWVEGGYTFFFYDAGPHGDAALPEEAGEGLHIRYVHRMKYSQWQDGAGMKPFGVGPLRFAPAWDPDPGEGVIRIDPGLAFGFGGHPTTRACLEALVRIYRRDVPSQVLDLGAGTGILALAAAALGARTVRAVEYSHLAWVTARRNVALNRLEQVIEVYHGLAEDHGDQPADLVCSNLNHAVQKNLLASGGFRNRRHLILSGLFHHEADELKAALTGEGYRLMDQVRDTRWATLVLTGDQARSRISAPPG